MKRIESVSNPTFKWAKSLIERTPKTRGLFSVEGEKLVLEALRSGIELEAIFVEDGYLLKNSGKQMSNLEELWREHGARPRGMRNANSFFPSRGGGKGVGFPRVPKGGACPERSRGAVPPLLNDCGEDFEKKWQNYEKNSFLLPQKLMGKLSALESPASIIGIFSVPEIQNLDETLDFANNIVVLDRIQDPGNLGTILRTCEGFDVDAILLLKGSCDPFNPKVIRAAAGSLFRLRLFSDLIGENLMVQLDKKGFTRFASGKDGQPLWNQDFTPKMAFFFGTEGKGLSKAIESQCQIKLTIPISYAVESLNVASAVSIFLYEAFRQKNIPVPKSIRKEFNMDIQNGKDSKKLDPENPVHS